MTQTDNTKTYTDIKSASALIRLFPHSLQPYAVLARLDRPAGWWLLLLPGLWAIVLAAGGASSMTMTHLFYILLFCIGAPVMRAAGCVMNDLWDRDLDKYVERTASRPLASGQINVRQALIFMALLLLIGLGILLQFNNLAVVLGFLTIPLIITYPLMKRVTWWPQLFLGITFNFGALIGWAAVTGQVEYAMFVLYVSGIFWTLAYDTIYAYQDIEDDMRIGIKSSARWIGDRPKPWIGAFFAITLCGLAIAKILAGQNIMGLIAFLPAFAHICWQIKAWQPDDQESSLKIFKANRDFGLLVLIAYLIP